MASSFGHTAASTGYHVCPSPEGCLGVIVSVIGVEVRLGVKGLSGKGLSE